MPVSLNIRLLVDKLENQAFLYEDWMLQTLIMSNSWKLEVLLRSDDLNESAQLTIRRKINASLKSSILYLICCHLLSITHSPYSELIILYIAFP